MGNCLYRQTDTLINDQMEEELEGWRHTDDEWNEKWPNALKSFRNESTGGCDWWVNKYLLVHSICLESRSCGITSSYWRNQLILINNHLQSTWLGHYCSMFSGELINTAAKASGTTSYVVFAGWLKPIKQTVNTCTKFTFLFLLSKLVSSNRMLSLSNPKWTPRCRLLSRISGSIKARALEWLRY